MNFKCRLLLSTYITLLSTTALYADYSEEISDASMYPFIKPGYPTSSINSDLHHYTVFGEMLYLKPYLGNLPFVYQQNLSNTFTTAVPSGIQGTTEIIKNIELDFDFGFRLGVGFNTTWMKMENQLTWMRLHTQKTQVLPQAILTSNPSLQGSPIVYYSYWIGNNSINPEGLANIALLNVQESTNFKWDVIDAVSKIPLSPFKRVTFSPLFGLRGLLYSLNSNLLQNSNAYGRTVTTTPPFNTYTIKLKNSFNAVGLIGGLDSDIDFGKGFHLSALLDAALVYGNLKSSNRFTANTPIAVPYAFPRILDTKLASYNFKPLFDFQVTLSWNINTANNRLGLNLHLGYELHYMPNFTQYLTQFVEMDFDTLTTAYQYNLMLQGLNAGLGISF